MILQISKFVNFCFALTVISEFFQSDSKKLLIRWFETGTGVTTMASIVCLHQYFAHIIVLRFDSPVNYIYMHSFEYYFKLNVSFTLLITHKIRSVKYFNTCQEAYAFIHKILLELVDV